MFEALEAVALNNLNFFKSLNITKSAEICESFVKIIEKVSNLNSLINEIKMFQTVYDLDEETPGNGYRSFIYIVEVAIVKMNKICTQVKKKRESIVFRRSFYEK